MSGSDDLELKNILMLNKNHMVAFGNRLLQEAESMNDNAVRMFPIKQINDYNDIPCFMLHISRMINDSANNGINKTYDVGKKEWKDV